MKDIGSLKIKNTEDAFQIYTIRVDLKNSLLFFIHEPTNNNIKCLSLDELMPENQQIKDVEISKEILRGG